MPGIAWLALHPPVTDPFPWWTSYVLVGMTAVAGGMGAFMVGTIVSDVWRDRKR